MLQEENLVYYYSEFKQKRKFCTFGSPNLVKSGQFRFSLPFACCIKKIFYIPRKNIAIQQAQYFSECKNLDLPFNANLKVRI